MPDYDPRAAAESRRKELSEMMLRLEKGIKAVFESDSYKEYLNFCAKLPRYSVNNQILIMLQRPDATMVQSFSGWKAMNRFVKKNEKGIRIFAPAPYKKKVEQDKLDVYGNPMIGSDGERLKDSVELMTMAFKPVSTFDISQTEGEPVPSFGIDELTGSIDGYRKMFDVIKAVVPAPISFEEISSGAKGYYHIEENRIVVQQDMSEVQTVKTILHEAAHHALHSRQAMKAPGAGKKSRNQREIEAESVAYIVCQHFGIDTSDYSFGYLASWASDKEIPELKASLDTIRSTASDMISKIENLLFPNIGKDVISNTAMLGRSH